MPLHGPPNSRCCQSPQGLRLASAATSTLPSSLVLQLHPNHRLVSRVDGPPLTTAVSLNQGAIACWPTPGLQHTPASTGASLEIYRDCIPARPGVSTAQVRWPRWTLEPVSSTGPAPRTLNLRYPIDNPLPTPQPSIHLSTALLHDLVTLMAPASNAFRMIRKRRFTFRSI